jgi:hypothetical protein
MPLEFLFILPLDLLILFIFLDFNWIHGRSFWKLQYKRVSQSNLKSAQNTNIVNLFTCSLVMPCIALRASGSDAASEESIATNIENNR